MNEFLRQCGSLKETRSLGTRIGELLQPSTVVGLTGTLGSGKTHLTQAIAAGLDVANSTVVSPTFTLCVPHHGRLELLHLDAYRIASLSEVDELALDESVEDGCVLIVEWAELIEAALPPVDLSIFVEHTGETAREFKLVARSAKGRALLAELAESVPS
ncbi:MAG: tRNA (adenosine(37)-N6)-threonylcarbamoyltransferase complex ATPase subunit type 1 TsaE [Planctomycetota bacterium]